MDNENNEDSDNFYEEFEEEDSDQYEDDTYIPIDISDPFGLDNKNKNNKNSNINNNKTTTTTTTTTTTATNTTAHNNKPIINGNIDDLKSYLIPSTANLGRTIQQLETDIILLDRLHKKFSDQLYRLKLEETVLEEQKKNKK